MRIKERKNKRDKFVENICGTKPSQKKDFTGIIIAHFGTYSRPINYYIMRLYMYICLLKYFLSSTLGQQGSRKPSSLVSRIPDNNNLVGHFIEIMFLI